MIDTEILVGDIVELSPTKMSTIDDLDLEKCTVLEVDKVENRIKVIFNNQNIANETAFEKESTIDWFSIKHVIDIERDYKVIDLSDTQDSLSGQEACIISMARVTKQALKTNNGYTVVAIADESVIDRFIFVGFTAHELRKLKGTTNRLSFAQYKVRYAEMDYAPVKFWQPKNMIDDPGDIFTMFNVGKAN